MKIAAIILFVLQLLSIFGGIMNGSFGDIVAGGFLGGVPGFSRMLGFFFPTIIGIALLIAHGKRKNKKNSIRAEELAKNPDAQAEKKGTAQSAAPAYDPEATVPSRNTQAQPKPASVLLTVTSGPMAGSKFRCREGNPVFVGRDPARCNLVLNGYTAVSGLHCRMDVSSSGVIVTDLNSSNGTFIGNVRLTPNRPASAANGVEIRLANTDCIFRVRFE